MMPGTKWDQWHTIGTMAVKGTKQGLLIGDVLLKGKTVVLVLLLEAWLTARPRHAGHGAAHACRALQAYTISHTGSMENGSLYK